MTGKTPADIVNVDVTPVIRDALPVDPPDRSPVRTTTRIASLAPGDHFFQWTLRDPIATDVLQQIIKGEQKLWIIATTTYVDRFKKAHRAGYGRRYIPTPLPGTKNNLILGEGTEGGYNYKIDIKNRS